MKISQEINKVLYYPLTDDTMMSNGGYVEKNINEEVLNILGDNNSSEAQDVLFSASGGPTAGVCCKGNEPCMDDLNECPLNKCGTDGLVIADFSCPNDTISCPLVDIEIESGSVWCLVYVIASLSGVVSDMSYITGQTGEWSSVTINAKSGGTDYAEVVSSSTYAKMTYFTADNVWGWNNVKVVSGTTIGRGTGNVELTIKVPGFLPKKETFTWHRITGDTYENVLLSYDNIVKSLRATTVTIEPISYILENGSKSLYTTSSNTYGITAKYTFSSSTKTVSANTYGIVMLNNAVQQFPIIRVKYPYQEPFTVSRSRPGAIFGDTTITPSLPNSDYIISIENLSQDIRLIKKTAKISDFQELFPQANLDALFAKTASTLCLRSSLSKSTSLYPFGCYVLNNTLNDRVIKTCEIIGTSGSTMGFNFWGPSFNPNTSPNGVIEMSLF